MATTVPGYEKRVPDYWLGVDPTVDADNIPHPMAGLFPSYLVDGGSSVDPDPAPTAVAAGTPGFFFPLGSNEDDIDALKANSDIGTGLNDNWDTKGQYVVLGDGSEAHYRLDDWQVGRVP